jgi:hypothetical protein
VRTTYLPPDSRLTSWPYVYESDVPEELQCRELIMDNPGDFYFSIKKEGMISGVRRKAKKHMYRRLFGFLSNPPKVSEHDDWKECDHGRISVDAETVP